MNAWLKHLGTGYWPMSDDWTQDKEDAENLDGVDFPYEPRSIQIGDKLVYYAPKHRKVFAVAEVTSEPYKTDREHWNYRCDVSVHFAVPRLRDAPGLEELGAPNERDLMLSVRQKPYVRLYPREYERAIEAIVAAAHDR